MSRPLRMVPRSARDRLAPSWRRPLLAWYRARRRDLPWRRTRDPYRVWVSEVMLQQTRVAAAREFYQKFLRRFPTLAALARAGEGSVLAAWAGLGYYRRARSLHQAARIVMRDHGGRVPDDPDGFGRLPGVGRYTAGAVLSIAFDRPLPALDGNVARVLARRYALPVAIREPRGAKELWDLATSLVPMRGAGDWTQALIELGATVCLARAPRCGICPVRGGCRALALGRVEEFPPSVPRRAVESVRRAVVVIERRGRVLMARREGALLGGLWEPPGVDLRPGQNARQALRAALRDVGVRARLEPTDVTVRHVITHRRIEVEVWRGEVQGGVPRSRTYAFVAIGRPGVAITALARKLGRASSRQAPSARSLPR